MKQKVNGLRPLIPASCYIHERAVAIGDVRLGENVSLWPNAVLRGDIAYIEIGEGSNVQENSTIHVNYNRPAVIGKNVTVGHNVVIHGSEIGDNCLIGMNATVMEAKIGNDCIIAAGSVLPAGKVIEAGSLVMGAPAKVVRTLSPAERAAIKENAEEYIKLAKIYKETCEDF